MNLRLWMKYKPSFKEINLSQNNIRYPQNMADIAPKLIHLSAEKLNALHERVHKSEATPATIEVHHTILNEMARRKMERPQDDWDKYEILVDSIDNVDLTTLGGLPAETVLEVIKATGDTAGNIKTFLTVNGYQMRVEPVEKRIQQEDGKWIVYNEEGTRSFGSYDSKEEAEERLRQIHAFSKADDTYTPPKAVRAAAQRAIEWIDNGLAGDGFTSVGRTRAGQLARGENISIETLKRMKSFFSRHAVDDKAVGFNRGEKGFPSAGRVAWDAWGGDAGFAWAESMVERYENRVEKHGDHDQSSHGAWAGGNAGGEDGGSSRPRMADDVKPSSERSADAVKQAERLRRDAEAVEPAVTSLMEGIAKTIGADFAVLDGKSSLEQRLKSTDSLARKIDADAEKDHGGDREKAASAISDAVRYTLNVDEADYTDGVEKTVDALEATGWKVESVKNFWQAGDPYDGTNIKLSKDGVKVELQLHTPQSHRVKEVDLHTDYETYRKSTDNVERKQIWDRMVEKAKAIPRPANMGKLMTLGTLVVQTYETAQQAGLTKSTGVDILWSITRGGIAVCGISQNQGLTMRR